MSKVNNDNVKVGGFLLLLKIFVEERVENLNGKIGILGVVKLGFRGNDEDIGIVNGKKFIILLFFEFYNLRYFLLLLMLC